MICLLHLSDNHGRLPVLDLQGDIIVHSGDMLPNVMGNQRPIEYAYQRQWVEDNASKLRDWIGTGRPFLYTPGNHDYYDPVPILRSVGVDAHLLCNDHRTFNGVRFYGFPWTPEFCGWNWMCGTHDMWRYLEPPSELMAQGQIDVFVSHGPMFGVLDRNANGTRCGSEVLKAVMAQAPHRPSHFLHGHIHESNGIHGNWKGMVVSNAATTQHKVTL